MLFSVRYLLAEKCFRHALHLLSPDWFCWSEHVGQYVFSWCFGIYLSLMQRADKKSSWSKWNSHRFGCKDTSCPVTRAWRHRDVWLRKSQLPTELHQACLSLSKGLFLYLHTSCYYFLPEQEVNKFLPFYFLYCLPSCINVGLMNIYPERILTMKSKFE